MAMNGFKRAKVQYIVITGVEANKGVNPPTYKDDYFYVATPRGAIEEGEYRTQGEAQTVADLKSNPKPDHGKD